MSRIFLYVYDLVTFVRVEIHWKKKKCCNILLSTTRITMCCAKLCRYEY